MKIIYKVITNNESINMCKKQQQELLGGVNFRAKASLTYDNRQVVDLGEFRILWIVVFLAAGNALLR